MKPAPRNLFGLAIVLVVTLSGSIQAQQDPCLNRTVAVNVLSEDVHVVEGLSAQNFRGKVHGHRVEIVSVNRDSGPRRIVIVLDASGSMRDVWRLEIVAAEGLLNSDRDSSFFSPRFHAPIKLPKHGQQVVSFATEGFDKEITDLYRLTIRLSESLDKPRDLELDVMDRNGKKNSRWLVVYPHRLAACP